MFFVLFCFVLLILPSFNFPNTCCWIQEKCSRGQMRMCPYGAASLWVEDDACGWQHLALCRCHAWAWSLGTDGRGAVTIWKGAGDLANAFHPSFSCISFFFFPRRKFSLEDYTSPKYSPVSNINNKKLIV